MTRSCVAVRGEVRRGEATSDGRIRRYATHTHTHTRTYLLFRSILGSLLPLVVLDLLPLAFSGSVLLGRALRLTRVTGSLLAVVLSLLARHYDVLFRPLPVRAEAGLAAPGRAALSR